MASLNDLFFRLDVISESKLVHNEMIESVKTSGFYSTNAIHNMGNLGQVLMIYFGLLGILPLIMKPYYRYIGDEQKEAKMHFWL